MFSVLEVKREARAVIRSALGKVLLVSFVYVFIAQLLSYLSTKVLYGDLDLMATMELILAGEYVELPTVNGFAELLDMAMTVMSYVLGVGFAYVALLVSRQKKAGVGELFDVFSIFIRALCLVVLQNIFIALWSLLFVIPGIVAAYRYSMAVFILIERPELSIMDCLRESKEITTGSKGKLFLLDLSFILWGVAVYAVSFILMDHYALALLCGAVIQIFYLPYYQISLANVYNRLSCWSPQPEEVTAEEAPDNQEQ